MVSLKDGHAPTADYVRKLREVLPAAFPEDMFYFQPADMATQILNFGLTAQIDVRTVGYDRVKNLHVAEELRRRIAAIPGVVDAHLQQEVYAPDFYVQIDRARALQFGLNASDIGNNISTSLSSSEQVPPNFWTDPTNGIPYYIAVQTPQYLVSSLNDLGNTPVSTGPPRRQRNRFRRARQCGDLRAGEHDNHAAGNAARSGRAQQCGDLHARLGAGQRQPGQHPAGLRGLCQHARPRSRQRRDRHRQSYDRSQETALARQHDPGDRPDRQHEPGLPRHDDRPVVRGRLRLPADGRQLPEFRRSVRRDPGAAGDLLRHRHDALHHRHDAQRSFADGRDHGGRCRLGKLDPARHLRARAAARRQQRPSMRRSRPGTPASGRC